MGFLNNIKNNINENINQIGVTTTAKSSYLKTLAGRTDTNNDIYEQEHCRVPLTRRSL